MKEEKCPKCNSLMVEVGWVDEEEPKGRLSWELEQGLIRLLECPKCKYYFWQEGHFGNIRNKDGTGKMLDNPILHNYLSPDERERLEKYSLGEIPEEFWGEARGWMIEYLAEHKFKQTHKVAKLTSYSDSKLCLNEEKMRDCLSFDQYKSDKILSDIKAAGVNGYEGLPDFLFVEKADKGRLFFVECKSVDSIIPPKQKLVFERLERLGYHIFVLEMGLYIRYINFDRFPSLINWRDKLST